MKKLTNPLKMEKRCMKYHTVFELRNFETATLSTADVLFLTCTWFVVMTSYLPPAWVL